MCLKRSKRSSFVSLLAHSKPPLMVSSDLSCSVMSLGTLILKYPKTRQNLISMFGFLLCLCRNEFRKAWACGLRLLDYLCVDLLGMIGGWVLQNHASICSFMAYTGLVWSIRWCEGVRLNSDICVVRDNWWSFIELHEGCQKNFLTKNSYVFCAVVYFKRWKEDRITADQRGAREEEHGRVIEEKRR